MTTLSRDASAARLLLDLTALSVKEPTRDRCVRPPSHHVNIQAAKFGELAAARFTLIRQVEFRYVSLGGCTRSGRLVDVHHLELFLLEMIIAASAMEPAASDVTRAVACTASSSMSAASSAYSNFAMRTVCAPVPTVTPGFT